METTKQLRGALTGRISLKAMELLGREITRKELRLFPYLIHVSMNMQRIDFQKVDDEEVGIIEALDDQGLCLFLNGSGSLRLTHEGWTKLTELVFLGYVDLSE